MKVNWSKVDQPDLVFQQFPSRRSQVYGTKGVIACSQPLAAEAGLEILRKGGNAADAAVATSAALNVTEPSCCGIGGDAFCLFYDAKTKTIKAMNGSGHSPQKLSVDYMRQRGVNGAQIPLTDLNSVTVPGAAAAWVDTVETLGSGKLTVAEVLAPAIRLAEEGVPVSEIHSYNASSPFWQHSEKLIQDASPNGHEMLLNGKAPLPGQIMKFPNLAQTFRAVAEQGKDGFYKGRIAEAIVELVQSKGGIMELNDLAKHETSFVEPIKYTYAGDVTVYECPPNGQGITALVALGILEQMQIQGKIPSLLELEHNSAEYLHALIEALRCVLVVESVDTQYYVTDPKFNKIPVDELLSREYLSKRAALFDAQARNPNIVHRLCVSASDQWGNACSFIQSNYAAVPKGCGFTLQNRGGGFVLQEGHPNCLQGGKRPYHTIIPAMALRGGDLFLSYGVMGGFMQPQGHVQVLLNMLRGFTAQAALDAPRFCISAGMPDSDDKDPAASRLGRGMMGRGQIIQKIVDPSGKTVWAAGCDPRSDGHAVAQI
ncbi:gamma-glutamyltranspeptidase [Suillus spraguei]|nr:gamma-glutamyltranspeptidase [Suillus spraguei]